MLEFLFLCENICDIFDKQKIDEIRIFTEVFTVL